jgi:hypothetical protein
MSEYTAIRGVSYSRRALLEEHITNDRDFRQLGVPIELNSPKEMRASHTTGASLWLYQIKRNEFVLNQPPARINRSDLPRQPRAPREDAKPIDSTFEGTNSFIVKIWLGEVLSRPGRYSWRGHITHVPSSERAYFQSLSAIPHFIAPYLLQNGADPGPYWRLHVLFRQIEEKLAKP